MTSARYRGSSDEAREDEAARRRTVTLPTSKIYGNQPVTYLDGRLMVAGKTVNKRRAS